MRPVRAQGSHSIINFNNTCYDHAHDRDRGELNLLQPPTSTNLSGIRNLLALRRGEAENLPRKGGEVIAAMDA